MKKVIISEKFLDEAINKHSRSLVGKCMKRFEIFDDTNSVKKDVKELIYESYRQFKELVKSYTCGMEFVSRPKGENLSE